MKHVHFIGIGGYSMSGLALLLHRQGYRVTGSDVNPSSRTERLQAYGIRIEFMHKPENVQGADWVVYNTDVREDNPERQAAKDQSIPLFHRSEILAQSLAGHKAITISGTHGKTTTTTMIGTMLQDAGLDPTVLVGGEVPQFEGNVRIGQGSYAVAEADESDGTFLRYDPWIAVATNIEAEHLDHYRGQFSALIGSFRTYLERVPDDGLAVMGIDNLHLADLARVLQVPSVTYGLHKEAMVRAEHIELMGNQTRFQVQVHGHPVADAILSVPGIHNVVNSLGAMAAAHHAGVSWQQSARSLESFINAHRRFQVLLDHPVMIVDDYAHHPTEVRSTLSACRQRAHGRVYALFQPQRYIRTKNLWDEFVEAFGDTDVLYLTDIYAPAGELPLDGVSGERLAEDIAKSGKVVHFRQDMFKVAEDVVNILEAGDLFITMGAGNVYLVARDLAKKLGARGVLDQGM
ncbi:MAG: UDP-N-acetylmuramate--L-alanine ligase [Firmicutes bacterium]|uniref:UDP-N-acetylmuramate--L-alanine ligase n=1 Tax=Sulfobacillus benefaciens TaxID=453960 RepID=A0A2T2X1G9_9FIRM|nr:UDP-N-acetylmuramate--L-alanine ligase [Bacillota bacterium]MCL5012854.1 UDP-N-acetylmuramate--L-alanine ligase [Bacillota bacterium]PSR28318.1 MAG: UDP-N-acetylmuramate--L-alanine ligase [Sulfobacillus benefaciens]